MTDPESRDILPRNQSDNHLFGYRYQFPLGMMGVVASRSMAGAIELLNEAGIEPFQITRMGPTLPSCLAEED